MMSVNDLNYTAASATEERANAWRHWIGVVTAATDAVVILAIVVLASFAYHLAAYGHVGNRQITFELAMMMAAIFVFTNLMRGRYQIGNYLSTKGQIASAFTVWNITMVAFIAITVPGQDRRSLFARRHLRDLSHRPPLIALARSGIVRSISMASKAGRITSERDLPDRARAGRDVLRLAASALEYRLRHRRRRLPAQRCPADQ
jgi:hypothetical protein